MKKILSFLVVMVLCTFTTNSQSQLLVEYRFDSPTQFTPGVLSPNFVHPTIIASASDLSFGSGLTTPGSNNSGANGTGFGCSCQPTDKAVWAAGWSSSFDLTDHFEISMTPSVGYTVRVDSVSWWERRSNTGPSISVLRSSTDGYSSNIWAGANGIITYIKRSVVSGLPTFSSPTPLDLRIYGYGSSSQNGTLRIDSLRVYGHVESILPIELISFTASAESSGVRLDWVTASERGNDYFTVLRSSDPTLVDSWEEVTRVGSVGDSQTTTFYESLDSNPLSGTSYYKLRQTDLDGTFTESHVVPVSFSSVRNTNLKVGDDAFIQGQNSYLIDGLGRVIAFERVHTLKQPGTYFLQGENNQVVRLHVLL